jgi:pyruvate formate lyase activating enzyme
VTTTLFSHFGQILDGVDLVLYDVKVVDETKHIALTSRSNKPILDNLRLAVARGVNIIVRIPVVPNVNASRNEFDEYVELMAEMDIKRVDLLPYYKPGTAKYRLLRRPYKLVAEALRAAP